MSGFSFAMDNRAVQLIGCTDHAQPLGTGFCFLRPDWIATAKHVVSVNGVPRTGLSVLFAKDQSVWAEVYAWHPEIDVAILRLMQPGFCRMPLFPAYARFTGEQGLVSVGYLPSRSDKDQRIYSIVVNKVEKWEFETRFRRESEEEIIVFSSPNVEPGHSGGPLLGQGGGVVGIVIEAFAQDGVPYARGTSILSLLNGIELRREWQPLGSA